MTLSYEEHLGLEIAAADIIERLTEDGWSYSRIEEWLLDRLEEVWDEDEDEDEDDEEEEDTE